MRYLVVIERGRTIWNAHAPDLPGCAAAAQSRDEALALVREAIELRIQDLKSRGESAPPARFDSEFIECSSP